MSTISSYGQLYDGVKVSSTIHFECTVFPNVIHRGFSLPTTQDDSLNKCYRTQEFETDHKNIYYVKIFNLYGQVKEEGFGINKFMGFRKFFKRAYITERDGPWKFYDNFGNKISECGYTNGVKWETCPIYQKPTIPMDTPVSIKILQVNTALLDCYNLYQFTYQNRKAQFIIEKDEDNINLQTDSIFKFCHIMELCTLTPDTNEKIMVRPRGSSFIIFQEDEYIELDFDKYSYYPTLRLNKTK